MSLTRIDQQALALAIEIMREESQECRWQIDAKLASEPWEEVGEFAAYHCQTRSLNLKPWQIPPCWISSVEAALSAPEDASLIRSAARLLQRMERCGVSKYHPDPARECARVEAEGRSPGTSNPATASPRKPPIEVRRSK